ncbi:MAG: GntR family transcriptional regulator [Anaerolineales bacterium]|nr:GntR family transcriptional regulator [Anaerolineales bacterium]
MTTNTDHRQLRRVVADRIRAAILDGTHRPGAWLRQERLAQEFGVSQMPVREALKELAAEGLVEHAPYRGVRVVEFSADDVADLYAARSFLEGMAARYAAERITPEALAELRALQAQMADRQSPADLAEYLELNRRFHQSICAASERAYLVRLLNQIWAAFPTMLWGNVAAATGAPLPERDARDLVEHPALLEALARRDAGAAEARMRQHVEATGAELVALLRQAPPSRGE